MNKDFAPEFTNAIEKRINVRARTASSSSSSSRCRRTIRPADQAPGDVGSIRTSYTEQANYDRTLRTEKLIVSRMAARGRSST